MSLTNGASVLYILEIISSRLLQVHCFTLKVIKIPLATFSYTKESGKGESIISQFQLSFIRYSCLLWSCFHSVHAWPKTFATLHLYKPIRSKTVSLSHLLFSRSMPARSACFEVWLVHWFVCVLCD